MAGRTPGTVLFDDWPEGGDTDGLDGPGVLDPPVLGSSPRMSKGSK
jgi:hypothetical protein